MLERHFAKEAPIPLTWPTFRLHPASRNSDMAVNPVVTILEGVRGPWWGGLSLGDAGTCLALVTSSPSHRLLSSSPLGQVPITK